MQQSKAIAILSPFEGGRTEATGLLRQQGWMLAFYTTPERVARKTAWKGATVTLAEKGGEAFFG